MYIDSRFAACVSDILALIVCFLENAVMRKGNPFVDTSLDPLSKLNLKETSDFVKSFPANKGGNKRNVVEAPSTPGRPVFSFSVGDNVSRKNFVPSKWNDAEKWLVSDHHSDNTAHHHHHLNGFVKSADFVSRKSSSSSNGSVIKQQTKVISEKTAEKASIFQEHRHHNGTSPSDSFDVLKDKFTNEIEPNLLKLECSEPLSESFIFKDPSSRDIGTEMTPLGSSTTSRCPTPFKSLSPPRHNTPATRSGPLDPTTKVSFDIGELQDCHLAKLKLETPFDLVASNWSSREEEEEDISKSLRHFEMSYECRKSISEPRVSTWEEDEKTKCCLRYQREEAKIQAWVDLQNAKAEAESRKLEVKIQKMRSKFEEKLMRKMAMVHRKAEELRTAAQLEHTEQIQKATTEQAKKTINQHQSMHFSGHSGSCGCFPCNNLHP
ncbi:hypothetical protein L2E82_27794 [Cichorium intybus]|uniref:Uncharacterized protein n=1 Tax=Cichorium intybus TaxID=13427 RepID=A0ACB9CU07_CICIN|nr:hypothetical protein L2E82_27794 [Cichorium intybus]